MIKKLIFLPLILLIMIGCTVTKRVHRPGYHIEWKKNYKNNASSKNEIKTSEINLDEVADSKSTIRPLDESQDNEVETHPSDPTEEHSEKINIPEKSQSEESKSLTESTQSLKTTIQTEENKELSSTQKSVSSRPIFWRISGKTLKILGLVLMGLGIMLLIGSMLSAAGAFNGNGGNNSDAGYYFVDTLLSLLGTSSWLWILIAIIVIILIIYLFVLIVELLFGSAFIGAIVGLSMFAAGFLIYLWGRNRENFGGE